jgi:hypothetical protein
MVSVRGTFVLERGPRVGARRLDAATLSALRATCKVATDIGPADRGLRGPRKQGGRLR